MSNDQKFQPETIKAYDRGMLRSAFLSLFWSIITERRKNGYTLQNLADDLGVDKSAISRWFGGDPNWTINTIADLANALDVELRISGTHRPTGHTFAPYGRTDVAAKATVEQLNGGEPQTPSSDDQAPPREAEPRLGFGMA